MDRRLFLGQTTAGLAMSLFPHVLAACPRPVDLAGELTATERTKNEISKAIRDGLIGNIQQLHVTHLYSPEQTSKATLLALAQRDFAWAEHLIGLPLPVDEKLLFVDSPSSTFGSYSTGFSRTGITVVWQGLARIGGQAGASTTKLRLYGSEGMLQTAANGHGCQVLDLRGRVIWSETTANVSTHWFS